MIRLTSVVLVTISILTLIGLFLGENKSKDWTRVAQAVYAAFAIYGGMVLWHLG